MPRMKCYLVSLFILTSFTMGLDSAHAEEGWKIDLIIKKSGGQSPSPITVCLKDDGTWFGLQGSDVINGGKWYSSKKLTWIVGGLGPFIIQNQLDLQGKGIAIYGKKKKKKFKGYIMSLTFNVLSTDEEGISVDDFLTSYIADGGGSKFKAKRADQECGFGGTTPPPPPSP